MGIARQFVSDWRTVHKPAMVTLATAADDLGKAARRNAKEQREASKAVTSGALHPSSSSVVTGKGTEPISPKRGADLAEAGYGGDPPPGYSDLSPEELKKLGVTPEMLRDPVNGFLARVLKSDDGKYVISFAGTNDGWVNWGQFAATPDALNNAEGAAYMSSQNTNAFALAKAVVGSAGKDNVTLVGHSLGGRNAAIASVATGAKAITYNAAGLGSDDVAFAMVARGDNISGLNYVAGKWLGVGPVANELRELALSGQVENHYTDFDIVTKGQQLTGVPEAAGKQVSHRSTTMNPVEAHDLKSFIF